MARSRNTCLFMLMAYLRIKPPRPGLEPWTRHRRPPLPRDLSILGLLYVKEGICNNKKKREIGEKENLNESLVLLRIVLLGWTCCTRKNWEMGWMLCRGGGAVGVWLVNNWFPWINLFLSYHPPLKVYRSYLDQWKKSIQRPTLIPQRRQVCTMQQWMPHVGLLLSLLVWFVLRNGLDTKQKTYLFCFNPSTSLFSSWTHFIGLLQDWWWGRCIGVDVWGTWSSRGVCTEGCEVIWKGNDKRVTMYLI